jgi:hypothetical protein
VRREELIWNSRLGMEEGVRVAGSGLGLLNGQTTMQDSIASEEGEGVVYSKQSRD